MPDNDSHPVAADQPPTGEVREKANAADHWLLASFEVFLILVMFFSYAGWRPPHINESHYLVKAKHYWDPAWCDRDFFLQSDDAHVVFFWSIGWLTRYVSLSTTAWLGRLAGWLMLAVAWRQLSTSVAPGRLISVLTAAWMLVLLEHFHMSGEWIVGGVEGKVFAYAFVWWGMAAVIRAQWRRAWIFFGLATAFHAVVGAWATLAALSTCVTRREGRRVLPSMVPTMVVGAILAAPSVLAGLQLDHGAAPEVATAAARIMVHGRLSHHLAIHAFQPWYIARFAALALVWLVVSEYSTRNQASERRLNGYVIAALIFAVIGAVIDQALLWNLDLAARILKYYWYRLADALLPVGVALTLASIVVRKRRTQPEAAGWLLIAMMLVPTLVLGTTLYERRNDLRPPADRGWDRLIQSEARRRDRFANWRRVCQWVRENTPEDALVVTPRGQQTFKWYAQRAELVNWKDVPQDAEHILEWHTRNRDWYKAPAARFGISVWTDRHLLRLAKKYDVQYLLLERGRMRRALGPAFKQVYPSGMEENSEFVVFAIPADVQPQQWRRLEGE